MMKITGQITKNVRPAIIARHFSTTPTRQEKVVELRQYTVKPDKVGTIEKLFTEHIATRYKYSPATGFWKAEFGTAINKLVSIWEYDSLDERANIRSELVKDVSWSQKFLPNAMNCLALQENSTMHQPDWLESFVDDLTDVKQNGIYELHTLDMEKNAEIKSIITDYLTCMKDIGSNKIVGAWINDIGNTNGAYIMLRYDDFITRTSVKQELMTKSEQLKNFTDGCKSHDTMVLLPCNWSKLK